APIVANAHRARHRATGSEEPQGWRNQISDGGEPTMRYAFARIRRAWRGLLGGSAGELTTTWRGSVGYLTELGFGVAARVGEIRTPWWSYNPQIADYAEKSVPVVASEGGGEERYLWGGFNIRARAYNAFLQGQFRDSEVTFGAGDLNPTTLEAWIGYTRAAASGWRLSYVLRAHTPEVRRGPADRTEVWGGIIVSYAR
ncbi:MAG: lipid A-modifier LpxR family protein, partial [Burkholderiales bacterium]